MTEQRITKIDAPEGTTHSTTTIITDDKPSGGVGKWFLVLAILAVAIVAFLVFSQMSDAEIAKDNAITNAAEGVGEAADEIGEAAGQVGEAARDAADSVTE